MTQNIASLNDVETLKQYGELLAEGVRHWGQIATSSRRTIPDQNAYFVATKECFCPKGEWIEDPEAYWIEAVCIAGPRKWFNPRKVIDILVRFNPYGQPSSGPPYREAMSGLQKVYAIGSKGNWDPKQCEGILSHVPAKEYFEAIRINGDSSSGFGRLPSGITEALLALGLIWIMQPPEHQRIPTFWQQIKEWEKVPKVQPYRSAAKSILDTHDSDTPMSTIENDEEIDDENITADSEDSSIEDVEAQMEDTKDAINGMLKEILQNQQRMEQAYTDQAKKLGELEKAFNLLRERLDSPEYGILQWKGDIQQLAKAMQLVETPDKVQKHSQLKQAIHNLEGSKRKRASIASTTTSKKSKPPPKKFRSYESTIEEDEAEDAKMQTTPANTPKKQSRIFPRQSGLDERL
ncbi:hypothetical protein F4815DRAFT_44497 [Daldinia loculata]|nr:hypothetical protein F4815DRAFT_44497 [Daldinia loculata]